MPETAWLSVFEKETVATIEMDLPQSARPLFVVSQTVLISGSLLFF